MTNHEKILQDLSIGQSTADSVAGRMKLPTESVEIMMDQLLNKKLIEAVQLANVDRCVFRLTSGSTKFQPKK